MAHDDTPGLVVPGVTDLRRLGRGGFGEVYSAWQISVGRRVAVKVHDRVLATERDRRRFLREAAAAGRLSGHPHIVSLYDAGVTDGGRPYLLMELCPGGSLYEMVARDGALLVEDVIEVGIGIADALATAHERGILHRDVKPANLLLDDFGTVKLADFGLAAVLDVAGESSATLEGLTPAYASPEAFAMTPPTPQRDVYGLGATLYALLAGRPPRGASWPPSSLSAFQAELRAPIPPIDGVPPALHAVLAAALEPEPADRIQTAAELRDALRAIPHADGAASAAARRADDGPPHPPAVPPPMPVPFSMGDGTPLRVSVGDGMAVPAPVGMVVPASMRDGMPVPPFTRDGMPLPPSVGDGRAVPASIRDGMPVPPFTRDGMPFSWDEEEELPDDPSLPPVTPAPEARRRRAHSAPTPDRSRNTPVALVATAMGAVVVVLALAAVVLVVHHVGKPLATASRGAATAQSGVATGGTSPGSSAPSPTGSAARAPTEPPLGFTACTQVEGGFCPALPQCWGGLVIISGVSVSARPIACDQPHSWETYAGGWLPEDLVGAPLDTVRRRHEVANVCSAQNLAQAARGRIVARQWQREVLPQQVAGRGEWVFHCVAAPAAGGERTGSVFG